MRLRPTLLLVLLGVGLGAAGPMPPAASFLRAEDARVGTMGFRIATEGRRFCPRLEPVSGLMLHHLGEYEGAAQAEVARLYGLDSGPGVLAVVPGSPAAAAGLRAGDLLVAVNGRAFSPPRATLVEPDAQKRRHEMERADLMIAQALRNGAAELAVLRAGRAMSLTLQPVPGCPGRVRLARSAQRNAFADGRYAIVTTRLLDFMKSEDELAVTLAHEMAHNILGHDAYLREQGVPIEAKGRDRRHAPVILATEIAADRLGLELAWAAGYDIDAALPFWRRLAAANVPFGRSGTHPSPARRERLLQKVRAELESLKPGAQRPELGEGALPQS